jgi:hypothetical protein
LIALAVNGPMHVRALARAIGSDSHKTWDMVECLRASGLVVKRDRPGGRKYAALNRDLPVYEEVYALLIALDHFWPAERVEQPRHRWRMPNDDIVTPRRLDQMFFSPVRSRMLLYVAGVGQTSMQDMYNRLGLGSVSALYAVNHWEREGTIRTSRHHRERLVELDPRLAAAPEMRALLRGLVDLSAEYSGYRKTAV